METAKEVFEAATIGDTETFMRLVRAEPTLLRKKNSMSQTPFWLAASCGMIEAINEIVADETLRQEAPFAQRDNAGRNAFEAARAMRQRDVVAVLSEYYVEIL